jgi:hypothetical protein
MNHPKMQMLTAIIAAAKTFLSFILSTGFKLMNILLAAKLQK